MVKVGSEDLLFEVEEGWGKLPRGWSFNLVMGVATDSHDRVYVFNKSPHPVIILDREGAFLASWGEGVFKGPHGIYISLEDEVYCTDNFDHTVRKFTLEGDLLMTLGRKDQQGKKGEPFNQPTNAALSPSGDLFITDGYGNSRVHKFSPDSRLLLSWGDFGNSLGQFNIPHGVWIDEEDRVMVADRENNRIEIFTGEGKYVNQWTDFRKPCSVFMDREGKIYVSELESRMSILSNDGELLARWGGEKSREPGMFIDPHCAWVDSHGDLYVGEVLDGRRLQKFIRKTSYD